MDTMDNDSPDAVARSDDPTLSVHVIGHKQMDALSPDDLATMIRAGRLELTIDSALSEWGSVVEELFHKLERSVNDWHDPNVDRTVTVRFVETSAADAVAGSATTRSLRADDVGS